MDTKTLLALSLAAISTTGCVSRAPVKSAEEQLQEANAVLAEVAKPVNKKGESWLKDGTNTLMRSNEVAFYKEKNYEPVLTPSIPAKNAAILLGSSNKYLFDWVTIYFWVDGSCSKHLGASGGTYKFRVNDKLVFPEVKCELHDDHMAAIHFDRDDKNTVMKEMEKGAVVLPELGARIDTSKKDEAIRGAEALATIKRLSK